MANTVLVFLLTLFSLCLKVHGDVCYYGYSYYYYRYFSYTYNQFTKLCSDGCCGYFYDRTCCSSVAGIIAGCVVAGIFVITVIIVIILCCYSHKKKNSRVIATEVSSPHSRVITRTVIQPPVYTVTAPQPYPPYGQPYGNDPAYPPPSYPPQNYNTGYTITPA